MYPLRLSRNRSVPDLRQEGLDVVIDAHVLQLPRWTLNEIVNGNFGLQSQTTFICGQLRLPGVVEVVFLPADPPV